MNELSVEKLKEELTYDKESGKFSRIFKCRPNSKRRCGNISKTGYLYISVGNKRYKAHRLAWLYVNGEVPKADLDHINGDKLDNRITNLRLANRSENNSNRLPPKSNKTGIKNAYLRKDTGKYSVQITKDGVTYTIGSFADKQTAEDAAKEARLRYHGEFAKT